MKKVKLTNRVEALESELEAMKAYNSRLNKKLNALEMFLGVVYEDGEYTLQKSREQINNEIIAQKGYFGMIQENKNLKDNKILKAAIDKEMGLDNMFRNDKMFLNPKSIKQSAQSLGIRYKGDE